MVFSVFRSIFKSVNNIFQNVRDFILPQVLNKSALSLEHKPNSDLTTAQLFQSKDNDFFFFALMFFQFEQYSSIGANISLDNTRF